MSVGFPCSVKMAFLLFVCTTCISTCRYICIHTSVFAHPAELKEFQTLVIEGKDKAVVIEAVQGSKLPFSMLRALRW